MSNYPADNPAPRNTQIEMHCSHCDTSQMVDAIEDLGMTDLVNEGDEYCPECGMKMTE